MNEMVETTITTKELELLETLRQIGERQVNEGDFTAVVMRRAGQYVTYATNLERPRRERLNRFVRVHT